MSVAPARRAALEVVHRVRIRDAYGPETLDAVVRESGLDHRDAALATRLAYGTLQTQGSLDQVIDRFASRPASIADAVRDVLRLATYELLFLGSPQHAVVHDAVDLVREIAPSAAGFANAVLRSVTREAESFPWGDPATDDASLALATGHPLWLVARLIEVYGRDQAAAILAAANEPAPLFVRYVPFVATLETALEALAGDGAEPTSCPPPGCFRIGRPQAAVRGHALADGIVLVADAAAQLAAIIADPRPGQLVLDLAAGRGTKTVQLQALAVAAGGPARVVAADIHPFKASILRKRLETLHVPGVEVVVADVLHLDDAEGVPTADSADVVLLDAPCSGTGTLRRHPEKRWRITPHDITRLAALQLDLVRGASSRVRPGGRLVYSTCSLLPEENELVIDAFLAGSAGAAFERENVGERVPEGFGRWIRPDGSLMSLPVMDAPDGHYVAALRRRT